MKVELPELAARLAGRLNRELRELVQLDVSSAWPVFRAVTADGRAMFVKVTEKAAAERTLIELDVLRRDKPLRLLAEAANDRIYARFK